MVDTSAVNNLRRAVQFEWTIVPAATGNTRSATAEYRGRRRTVRRVAQTSVRLDENSATTAKLHHGP